eukprot:TRINITY_DN71175_c0_g1_i1.p1 TRINITY_DN71175_c0_g1~~TRINITY_DN71175_c0_g1_i1.p1  ORF type:complete len:307 (+),score=60.00 TRINITY_DN71175_c0_g1_i1:231-1151(+)
MLPSNYGSAPCGAYNGYPMKIPLVRAQRKLTNPIAPLISLFVPWILFTALFCIVSFSLHYNEPSLYSALQGASLFFVALFGYSAYLAKKRSASGDGESYWPIFLFLSTLLAWLSAMALGTTNFSNNMQPYYDIVALNRYPSVDPNHFRGQQLMDAGRIEFTPQSHLALQYSMGFRNLDTYCVAPVTAGNSSMETYDFWAVGINCCKGHAADFACGEFNNPAAHSGLRLMRDDLKPYFRLAVQQAEAHYNIKANHPVFMYWMSNPNAELAAYEDAGFQLYAAGIGTYFVVQFLLVFLASCVHSRYCY